MDKVTKQDEYFFCLSECDITDKECVIECVDHLHDVPVKELAHTSPKPQRVVL
jgi:hypothetical protein